MDYKYFWQEQYDKARDRGLSEVEAGQVADDALADHYAAQADALEAYEREGDYLPPYPLEGPE